MHAELSGVTVVGERHVDNVRLLSLSLLSISLGWLSVEFVLCSLVTGGWCVDTSGGGSRVRVPEKKTDQVRDGS